MRNVAGVLVVALVLSCAQSRAEVPSTGPTRQAHPPQYDSPPVAQHTVDELDVPAGSSVADLLHQVQQKVPEFQYVVEPGPWEKSPLPQMRLRAATLEQVVQMLTNVVPNLEVANLSRSGPMPFYVFSGRNRPAPADSTELLAFGLAEPVERIRLRNALAGLAKEQDAPTPAQMEAARKNALKDVLSLLESAVEQADPGHQASLKLHEQTEVLLVRGTVAQLKAVNQALGALESSAPSRERDMTELLARLRNENTALKQRIQEISGKSNADQKH